MIPIDHCHPGDIVFFSGRTHKAPIDYLIMARTNSEYVHVGVVGDDAQMTSARSDGVHTEPIPSDVAAVAHTGVGCRNLDAGLKWLYRHVGQAYGVVDILNQLISMVNADLPELSQDKAWDCSDTVVRFLTEAEYQGLPPEYMNQPHTVTPGMLAQVLLADGVTYEKDTAA